MSIPSSLVVGADDHVGAYLARLLAARGETVAVVGERLLTALGIAEDVEALRPDEAIGRAAHCATLYVVDTGDGAGEMLFRELLAAVRKAPGRPLLINIVDIALCARHPDARARVRDLVVQRSEAGARVANALLHRHDSRLGPVDSLPAQIIAHLADHAAGRHGTPLEIADPGPQDWGWTAEYVDAVQRLTRLERPTDIQIATGRQMTVSEMIAHAAEWFRLDPSGLFRITGTAAATPAPAVDPARLKAATGWSAGTWGRDLMRTLAEGRAA